MPLNGVVERFNRTLKEQVIHGRVYRNLDELRDAVRQFVDRHNAQWLTCSFRVRNLTTIGGAAMTVMKKDRSPEERKAVWKFLSWMTSPENLAEWSRKSGYSSPRKSSYDVPEHIDWGKKYPETLKVLEPLKCCAYPQFQVYKGVAVRKAIEDQAQAVMTGKKSIEEALKAAQKNANEIMKPYIDATVIPPT